MSEPLSSMTMHGNAIVSSVEDLFLAQVKAPEVVVSETASLGNA